MRAANLRESSLVRVKALGDANADLVYTPVSPCRLFDTRASQGGTGILSPDGCAPMARPLPVAKQGGPGGCAAAAGAVVALIQIGTIAPTANGLLQGGPQGAVSLSERADPVPARRPVRHGGGDAAQCRQRPVHRGRASSPRTDLYGDLLGYFKPATGFVSNVATGTGLTGGPITSTGTISADTTYLQRRVSGNCPAGSNVQAVAADGTVTCQNLTTNATSAASATTATSATTAGTITGTITGSQVTGSITTAHASAARRSPAPITTATVPGSQITGTIGNATVPGAIPTVIVSGTSQQAASNTAYLVTSATLSTITLPAAPAVGDLVKATSPGVGGFALAANAGQTIGGINTVAPIIWTARDSARNWGSGRLLGRRQQAGGGGQWRPDLHLDRQRRDLDPARQREKLAIDRLLGRRQQAGRGGTMAARSTPRPTAA